MEVIMFKTLHKSNLAKNLLIVASLILMAILFSLFLNSCGNNVARGNTSGNILNYGHAAIQGDRIYYSNANDNGYMYAIKTDGTDNKKLNDDVSAYINVAGDLIYYCNSSDGRKLYTMKTDGTDKQKLNDDWSYFITVIGDLIYYSNGDDDWKPYTMKTGGTDRKKLNDDMSSFINVENGRIYYCNDSDNGKLYTIKINGKDRKKLSDDVAMWLNVVGNRIYYSNDSDDGKLYTIKTNGKDRKKLSDDAALWLNVANDRIYYHNVSDGGKLYTIKIDGSDRKKLNDDVSLNIHVVGDRIYYFNGDDYKQYTMKTDGTDRQIITSAATNGDDTLSYLDTSAEKVYELFLEGKIDYAELLKYVEVQKEIGKDVNKLLDNYRTGIYPLEDTGDRTNTFIYPFPKNCTIPSDIKWEDIRVELADSLRYNYDIVIELENDYIMSIEGYFNSTDNKILLIDASFYNTNQTVQSDEPYLITETKKMLENIKNGNYKEVAEFMGATDSEAYKFIQDMKVDSYEILEQKENENKYPIYLKIKFNVSKGDDKYFFAGENYWDLVLSGGMENVSLFRTTIADSENLADYFEFLRNDKMDKEYDFCYKFSLCLGIFETVPGYDTIDSRANFTTAALKNKNYRWGLVHNILHFYGATAPKDRPQKLSADVLENYMSEIAGITGIDYTIGGKYSKDDVSLICDAHGGDWVYWRPVRKWYNSDAKIGIVEIEYYADTALFVVAKTVSYTFAVDDDFEFVKLLSVDLIYDSGYNVKGGST